MIGESFRRSSVDELRATDDLAVIVQLDKLVPIETGTAEPSGPYMCQTKRSVLWWLSPGYAPRYPGTPLWVCQVGLAPPVLGCFGPTWRV